MVERALSPGEGDDDDVVDAADADAVRGRAFSEFDPFRREW